MALYSVADWKTGDYRVYRHPKDTGLFDVGARAIGGDPRLGVPIEQALVELPPGAQFIGRSPHALGRVAVDAVSRSQASARLPTGIGALGGLGSISPPPDHSLAPGGEAPPLFPGLHMGLKLGPLLLMGVVGLVAIDAWMQHKKKARARARSRARNAAHAKAMRSMLAVNPRLFLGKGLLPDSVEVQLTRTVWKKSPRLRWFADEHTDDAEEIVAEVADGVRRGQLNMLEAMREVQRKLYAKAKEVAHPSIKRERKGATWQSRAANADPTRPCQARDCKDSLCGRPTSYDDPPRGVAGPGLGRLCHRHAMAMAMRRKRTTDPERLMKWLNIGAPVSAPQTTGLAARGFIESPGVTGLEGLDPVLIAGPETEERPATHAWPVARSKPSETSEVLLTELLVAAGMERDIRAYSQTAPASFESLVKLAAEGWARGNYASRREALTALRNSIAASTQTGWGEAPGHYGAMTEHHPEVVTARRRSTGVPAVPGVYGWEDQSTELEEPPGPEYGEEYEQNPPAAIAGFFRGKKAREALARGQPPPGLVHYHLHRHKHANEWVSPQQALAVAYSQAERWATRHGLSFGPKRRKARRRA